MDESFGELSREQSACTDNFEISIADLLSELEVVKDIFEELLRCSILPL